MGRIRSKQSQANSFGALWNAVEVGSLPPPLTRRSMVLIPEDPATQAAHNFKSLMYFQSKQWSTSMHANIFIISLHL